MTVVPIVQVKMGRCVPPSLNWQQGDRVTRLFSECAARCALAGVGGRRLGPGLICCERGVSTVEVLDLLVVLVHHLAVCPPCHLLYRPACLSVSLSVG